MHIELDFGFVVITPPQIGPLAVHLTGRGDPRTERAAFVELAFIAEIISELAAPPATNGLPESECTGDMSNVGSQSRAANLKRGQAGGAAADGR